MCLQMMDGSGYIECSMVLLLDNPFGTASASIATIGGSSSSLRLLTILTCHLLALCFLLASFGKGGLLKQFQI